MVKHVCVAVYPVSNVSEDIIEKWGRYISMAKSYGCNEVFSTMHLPELTLSQQIDCVVPIALLAKENGMEYTVDIGGPFITEILENEELLNKVRDIQLDFIRLDYGYSHQQVQSLYEKLNVRGFVINASIYSQEAIERELAFFSQLDNCQVRACHNYYPREETGVSKGFAMKQDSYFRSHGLPVYYCIPSHTCPRGPIHKGLPTLEQHRYMNITDIALDLAYNLKADGVMLADEFFSEEELKQLQTVIDRMPLKVRISCDEKYDSLLLKDHIFRYDSNFVCIRSKSSRQMAEFASKVTPDNCVDRKPGDITVDNENYQRYSGEVQVIMKPLLADKRVNVAGKVEPDDLYRLSFYREGLSYTFVKE